MAARRRPGEPGVVNRFDILRAFSAEPTGRNVTGDRRCRCGLSRSTHLRSIVGSWQDTLDDELILDMLRNWNAGLPLFHTVYASASENDCRDEPEQRMDTRRNENQ